VKAGAVAEIGRQSAETKVSSEIRKCGDKVSQIVPKATFLPQKIRLLLWAKKVAEWTAFADENGGKNTILGTKSAF